MGSLVEVFGLMCLFVKRIGLGLWLLVGLSGLSISAEETKSAAYPRTIVNPLEFVDGKASGKVNDATLTALLNRKLVVGADDGYEFLTKDEAKTYLRTETIAQYRKARAQGAGPWTTFDITMDSFFVDVGGSLRFLEHCRDAEKSAFKDAWLKQLSISMLGWRDSDQKAIHKRDKAAGLTLADYARDKKIKFTESAADRLKFEFGDRLYVVDWAASGDYDGDGFEDRLICVAWYYKEGSGRSYDTYVAKYADSSKPDVSLTEFYQFATRTSDEVD